MKLTALALVVACLCGCTTTTKLGASYGAPTGDDVANDLGYREVNRSHLLAFLAVVDHERQLYVESAIVAFELQGGRWRMADVYRNNRGWVPDSKWRKASALHVRRDGSRDFDHPPTKSEAERFMRDSGWHSRPDDGFRTVRGDNFPKTWETVLGYVPRIPR